MADKRYYWLKLDKDFFRSLRIKKLRKIAGGDTYTIIYLKMQLLSLQNGGCIEYKGIDKTIEDELALDLDEDIENVKITVQYLLSCGLMETSDDVNYTMPYVQSSIGSECSSASRVRNFRDKQRALADEGNGDALQCNAQALLSNKSALQNNDILDTDTDIDIKIKDIVKTSPSSDDDASVFHSENKSQTTKKQSKRTDIDEIASAWNDMASGCGLPQIAKMTDARRRKTSHVLDVYGMDDIKKSIAMIPSSNFLTGRNDRGWRADFDFLLEEGKICKILEGGYSGASRRQAQHQMVAGLVLQ